MKDKEGEETAVCFCCGHMRAFPNREGLWEYLEHPIFDPDGTLGDSTHNRHWIKASIIDVGKFGKAGDCEENDHAVSLRLVPVGMKRAIDWPERAVWRKLGDVPEITPGEVIDDGYRLRDGKWMGKWDDESDSAMRRLFWN